MHWYLFGSSGWIGSQLLEFLTSERVTLATVRADETEKVRAELLRVRPDRVVAIVGRTHSPTCNTIDCLEDKEMLYANLRDNLFAQVSLALLCQELGIHFTAMSTGCIYEYDDEYPLEGIERGEHTLPNFFGSSYSVVKGFCDRLLTQTDALWLRLRMPISDDLHSRSFLTKILNYSKVCSIPNSMSVLPTLLPVMIDLVNKGHRGPVNFTNPGVISHNTMLALYREIVDPTLTWENFSLEEQAKVLKSGRSNNALIPETILQNYPEVPNILDAVRQVLLKIKADQAV